MIRIKFCGITRPEDAATGAQLGAWALGFVFASESPRRISPENAAAIISGLPDSAPKTVGVFMDQPVEEILSAVQISGVDFIQLHGAEPLELCEKLGSRRCIRSVTSYREDLLCHPANYLLFDRLRTAEGTEGPAADWEAAKMLAARHANVLLAGGLTADNVEAVVKRVRPWGVDVSSSVESAPGIKDAQRMTAFHDAVRRAEETL